MATKRRLIPDPLHFCLYFTLGLIGLATWRIDANARPGAARRFTLDRVLELWDALFTVMKDGWFQGFGNEKLLALSFQMCLILLTGSALARTSIARRILGWVVRWISGAPQPDRRAAWVVALVAVLTGFLNWGFSLILSSMLALELARERVRSQGESPGAEPVKLNFPLIAAAAYMGLLVWQGGLSGSIPLLANEKNALAFAGGSSIPPDANAPLSPDQLDKWKKALIAAPRGPGGVNLSKDWITGFFDPAQPDNYLRLDVSRTLGHRVNLVSGATMLVLIPLGFAGLAQFYRKQDEEYPPVEDLNLYLDAERISEAESPLAQIATVTFALLGLALFVGLMADKAWKRPGGGFELVILLSLCAGLLAFRRPLAYQAEFQAAGQEIAPIVLQFPFYWGIYGILELRDGMLVKELAEASIQLMNQIGGIVGMPARGQCFTLSTYVTACLVHLGIPSGGGQWMIQGPVSYAAAARGLDPVPVDPARIALAIAYGNQTANMIQPFWILPVIAFTRADPRRVLFYSAHSLILGVVVYGFCLLFV